MHRLLDGALDLLLWPYHEMHDAAVADSPDASIGEVWLFTWLAGSALLVVAWAFVAFAWNQLCLTLYLATRQLHQRADQGATLETRRRNARRALLAEHLILRMRRWSRVTMWPVPDRDDARLTARTLGAIGARAILSVPAALAGIAATAKNVLTRPVGLATIAAATWVTDEPGVRRLLADLQSWMSSATGIAIPLYALTFAVITFTLTNAVHWRRRGLGKWRTDHAAAAYETLSKVRAHATTMAEALDLEAWHSIAVVLDYHVERVLADDLDELLDDRLDQLDAEHDRPLSESRLRRRGDREYRRMTLDPPPWDPGRPLGQALQEQHGILTAAMSQIEALTRESTMTVALAHVTPSRAWSMVGRHPKSEFVPSCYDPAWVGKAVEGHLDRWRTRATYSLSALSVTDLADAMPKLRGDLEAEAERTRDHLRRMVDQQTWLVCRAEARLLDCRAALGRHLYPHAALDHLRALLNR